LTVPLAGGDGGVGQRHVVVVNQHGDNRGDEAALRGMLAGLHERLAPVRFTIVHQFGEPSSCVEVPYEVEWLPSTMPRSVPARLVVTALLRWVRLPWRWAAGEIVEKVHDAYDDADLVVSAPGGPYFGEVYAGHEPLHWLYVLLAAWRDKPAILYAPSAGPFTSWWRPLRRRVLRSFRRVAVREDISAENLRGLMGDDFAVEVTADSALQSSVEPLARSEWRFDGETLEGRTLIVVSAIDRPYAGDTDPPGRRRRYDDAVVAALADIAGRTRAHVAFVPQVHGRHRDQPYLERLARRLHAAVPEGVTIEVVDERLDSDAQRSRFAAADLVLAGRYHPAVFAISAEVPLVCVPYEHKAAGLMAAAGLEDLSLPIDDVTTERLTDLLHRAHEDREDLRARLTDASTTLSARAARTSDMAAECVEPRG
jgi:colanic acid/amylovoran biosynthesis protein